MNERYRAEVPTLLAGSLAHDLLWSGPGAGQYEEVVLHALVALVHLQLLARTPALAHTGTELARRQNSLAITLVNSRHPGSADIAVRAPDGPGTIPGGAPAMQTPDFWSIPFVSGTPVAAGAPALLGEVLARATGATPPSPLRYDDAPGRVVVGARHAWCARPRRAVASRGCARPAGPGLDAVNPTMNPKVQRGLALLALSLRVIGLKVVMIVFVVLLPTIGSDLGVTPAVAGAIVTVASLAFAAPLLLIGRIADRVGARPVLLVGVVGFAIASAICAWSETFGVMMLGRSLQGIASACCFTTSLAAIDALVAGDDSQPMAVGIWGALGGIGGACGPLVASLLNEAFSWRAFFGVNLILLSVAFVLLVWLVPHLPADRTRSVPFVTLVLLMFGIASVTAAIQHVTAAGWLNAATIGGILVGAALLVIVWLRVRGREPLIAASVMRLSAFRLGTETATLSNWGSGVVIVLVPTALEIVRGVSVLEAGILFLGFSIPFALGGLLSGFMIRSLTAPRTLALSSAVMAVGMVAMAIVGVDGALGPVILTLAVIGLGNGVVYSAATSYALIDVETDEAAEASAALSAARVLGFAIAIAISTSMMTTIDDADFPGADSWGLRVALLVGAAVTGVGWWLARRARVAAPERR